MSKYKEYMEMGLTEERYFQMMKSFDNNEEFIDEAIEDWGIERVNKGYDIFDFDGTGMLQIEEIGATDAFNGSDERATDEAMADGIKIIPLYELPEDMLDGLIHQKTEKLLKNIAKKIIIIVMEIHCVETRISYELEEKGS